MGAPIGSVLVGTGSALSCPAPVVGLIDILFVGNRELIERARHFRKVFGGGWRQSGILAAAGLYAIEHHWPKMAQDHENAAFVAKELQALGFGLLHPVETNMIWADSSRMKFTAHQWGEVRARDLTCSELRSRFHLIFFAAP